MKILITGGAGFIGSALVRYLVEHTSHQALVYDKLTYSGNLQSIAKPMKSERCSHVQGDVCDPDVLASTFAEFQPDAVMHLAAESHVDRSIAGPGEFMQTNIIGTYCLLEAARHYFEHAPAEISERFRFHHISTDEVYGDLGEAEALFREDTAYDPSSPYSASKASADHLVRAWSRTYGLPVLVTNCSNNYGPYQFPEKFIPHIILSALAHKPLPVYGAGTNVRDWLYVDDHVEALVKVLEQAKLGETYNIGGNNQLQNIDVVKSICDILTERLPGTDYHRLITYVEDRKGHDLKYAIDTTKIKRQLDWQPLENFASGLDKTVQWYIDQASWWQSILDGSYQLERLGN